MLVLFATLGLHVHGLHGVFDRCATLNLLDEWKWHISQDQYACASGLRKYHAARVQYREESSARFSVLDDHYNLFLLARSTTETTTETTRVTAALWNVDETNKQAQFAKLRRWYEALDTTISLTGEHLADAADYAIWCTSFEDDDESCYKGVVTRPTP